MNDWQHHNHRSFLWITLRAINSIIGLEIHMRIIVWFSCGAASAVSAKIAVNTYGGDAVDVVYCDLFSDEHPDNRRFFGDVQKWIGKEIKVINSDKYSSVDDVFDKTRYMSGINGARCTVEMKKMPRFAYQQPHDTHVFGLTADEDKRIDRFNSNHPDLKLDWVLQTHGYRKEDCYRILRRAKVELPVMYSLGYRNNNCLGCVKATSAGYWNMIRRDFPDTFEKRAKQSRDLGVRLTRVNGERVFLDELPADYIPAEPLENISCGPDCGEYQNTLFDDLGNDR